eukprot:11169244-Lingulodinium_polyedra.AAC.2
MPKRAAPPPSWEEDGPHPEAAGSASGAPEPWEAAVLGGPEDDKSSEPGEPAEDDDPAPDPAQEYVNHMLMLYFRRKIVAADFCIAMHWAALAGLEAARAWARPPGL